MDLGFEKAGFEVLWANDVNHWACETFRKNFKGIVAEGSIVEIDDKTIPEVDVITGGSSSIYGSDAVAGVVNFVLRRDFEGVTARAQGGVSDRSDRGSYFVSVTAGKNFSEGRGNVTISAEYAVQNALYYTDRDDYYGAFSGRNQFNAYDIPSVNHRPAMAFRTTSFCEAYATSTSLKADSIPRPVPRIRRPTPLGAP